LVVIVGEITAAARAKISVSVAHASVSDKGTLTFGRRRAIVNAFRPSVVS
jgi:hypothetical protein